MYIERMSFGDGNPGGVPVTGRHLYPTSSAGSAPDGTGDFDSASRGGPASSSQSWLYVRGESWPFRAGVGGKLSVVSG